MSGPVVFVPPFRQLVDGVSSFFADHGITASVARGWKARAEQINQGPGQANRVIFMPSKSDGTAGAIVNPRQVGQREIGGDPTTDPPTLPQYSIRALSDWSRSLVVSIWAYDGDNPNDEGAQCDAVDTLQMWTQWAVQSVAFGNAVWGATKFTVPAERSFGLELLVDLTFQSAIYDLPAEIGNPGPAISKGSLP